MGRDPSHVLLEREWAEFNGLDPAGMVVCSSGTAALHLALEVLCHEAGGDVVMPDYTMIACPRAAVLAGLGVRLVDCGPDLLMDDGDPFGYATVERYCGLMAVHVYGRRPDMGWLASTSGVCHPVVEDLAEAHGTRPHDETDAACWSFYKNKIVAGEEGGAVWFRNPDCAKWARRLRTLGFTEAHDYTHVPRGHNYRLADLLAEPVRESVKNYPVNLARRREAEGWYEEACPAGWRMPGRDAPWVYDVRVPGLREEQRYAVVGALQAVGIAARHGFRRVSTQEEFRDARVVRGDGPDVTGEVFYLPLTPGVTREQCRQAFEVIYKVLG